MNFAAEYTKRVSGPVSTIIGFMNFSVSFLLGHSSLARSDSIRKFFLQDIRADCTFGPDRHLLDNWHSIKNTQDIKLRPCLSMVIHPNDSKERNSNKQEVGSYRHKYYLYCPVGNLGFSMFLRLNDIESNKLNFTIKDGKRQWDTFRVVTYVDYNPQYEQFKGVFDTCNIRFNKVCHVRSAGISTGAIKGLSKETIAYQSKHVTDKLDKAYMPELSWKVSHSIYYFFNTF